MSNLWGSHSKKIKQSPFSSKTLQFTDQYMKQFVQDV